MFCSFVVVVGQEQRSEAYVQAVTREMKNYQGFGIHTVYLGGGTPTMLHDNQLRHLMASIRENFLLDNDAEITIEANPETIDLEKAKALKRMGFNRVSLGVQSFNDRYLKFLGRSHSSQKAIEAHTFLRQAGFMNINLDLMYAFPEETQKELEDDVRKLAALTSEHVSLYTLTIEPNSRFHAINMKLGDNEELARHYLLVIRLLETYGFKQYEVSNFARGEDFKSLHNMNYWKCGRYIGLGMGAHGFLDNRRYWNTSNFNRYLETARTAGVIEGYEDLSRATQGAEKLLFGLRMNQGVLWDEVTAGKHPQIQRFIEDGFLIRENGFLKATSRGRLVLDELSAFLI